MGYLELTILALGLAMDAFAVSICLGLNMTKASFKNALIVGLYFGIFQAVMPLIGYFTASLFAGQIQAFDHWIAFALLLFLGAKMIYGSFKKNCKEGGCDGTSLHPKEMLPFAVATSIDALAVGISFAFLEVSILPAVAIIGIITLILAALGVKIGKALGIRFRSKAEVFGGIILILIGLKIVFEHAGIIG